MKAVRWSLRIMSLSFSSPFQVFFSVDTADKVSVLGKVLVAMRARSIQEPVIRIKPK